MKTTIALLLLSVFASLAVTPADELLVIGGKVRKRSALVGASKAALVGMGVDYISGRAVQSVLGGVLVSLDEYATRERFTTVFVEGVGQHVDGDAVAWFAAEGGVLEYKTVLGANKTVRKFVPALKPTKDQVLKFQTLELLDEQAASAAYQRAAKATAEEEQRMRAEIKAKAAREAADAAEASRAQQYAADAKVTLAYHRRAASGDAESQYEMGLRYLAGKGVGKSEKKAHEWLEKAAVQGHAKSKSKLLELTGTAR